MQYYSHGAVLSRQKLHRLCSRIQRMGLRRHNAPVRGFYKPIVVAATAQHGSIIHRQRFHASGHVAPTTVQSHARRTRRVSCSATVLYLGHGLEQ